MELTDLRRAGRSAVDKLGRASGYELVRRHFDSPIPDLRALPTDVWNRKSELPGVAFPADAGLSFVQGQFGSLLKEYRPPVASTEETRDFHLDNGSYEWLDAHTLCVAVRRYAPRRIPEFGMLRRAPETLGGSSPGCSWTSIDGRRTRRYGTDPNEVVAFMHELGYWRELVVGGARRPVGATVASDLTRTTNFLLEHLGRLLSGQHA